jgi:general secretion pathway protein C
MPARFSAFVVWALVAASALFWGFRWRSQSSLPPVAVAGLGAAPVLSDELGRVLGSAPAAPATTTVPEPALIQRFRLLGVVATRREADARSPGIALIAVDSGPPRAFGVGSALEADVMLQSVGASSATLGNRQGAVWGVLQAPPIDAGAARQIPGAVTFPPGVAPPNLPNSTRPPKQAGSPATVQQ